MAARTKKLLIKIAVAVGALALLGFLFMRSVHDARSEPYTVPRAALAGWAVVVDEAAGPAQAVLGMKVPSELVNGLFHQVFTRTMESMSAPTRSSIALVLKGELAGPAGANLTPDLLLATAAAAGLDAAAFTPRCLAHRRASTADHAPQLFFVLFDSPAFTRFRQQVAALAGGGFDPDALSPLLVVSTTDPGFDRWLPMRAVPEKDCMAPVVVR